MSEDAELMAKYHVMYETRRAEPGTCDENCARKLLCQINHLDYEDAVRCEKGLL